MAAIITDTITAQAYELIRNQIGSILIEELPNQATLNSDPKLNATVYIERFAKIDKTEVPCINISLATGTYDDQDLEVARGNYRFNIDVYSSAPSTATDRGDKLAIYRTQRLLGVCRAILQNSKYYTLGFNAGFVTHRQVESIGMNAEVEAIDSLSLTMGRLVLFVKAPEVEGVSTALAISQFSTQVQLNLSAQGYVFTGQDIPTPTPSGEIKVNNTLFIDLPDGDNLNIPVVDDAGTAIGTVNAGVNVVIADAVVRNAASSPTYTQTVQPEQTLTLPEGKMLDSDGGTVTAAYIPSSQGFMFTAQAAGDVNLQLNGVAIGTAAPSSTSNQVIQDDSGTSIGTAANPSIISDSAISINGTALNSLNATQALDIEVVDSASNPVSVTIVDADTIQIPDPAGTVILTVSDSTPNFGDTVTLTVTPTGITPSSYQFWIPQEDNTYRIITQATNTYSWKVDIYGAWTVRGGANTLSASAYDIDGVDIMSRHVVAPYARPSDWMAIPTINVGGGEEVSYFLMQVFDTAHNYIAVTCEADFTIDWGDGSTPVDYASGTQAENDIAYSSVSNLSTRGYRQALVKITPQSGQNLTLVNYGVRHSGMATALISSQILEIDQHLPNATTFKVYTNNQRHYYLEQFNWRGTHSVTSFRELFRDCSRLQSVVSLSFTNVADCYRVFYSARVLRNIPSINITSCTVAQEMFYATGLEWLGDVIITGTVTNYTSLFRFCSKLLGIESLTLSTSTSAIANLLFHTCYSLHYVPNFVYNGTSVTSLHESNLLLQYIPSYDFPNNTSLSSFAKSCRLLRKPCKFASTTANVTSLYRAYNGCVSMITAMRSGEHDFSSVTTARECYSGNAAMKFSHTIDLPNCTNFQSFQAGTYFKELEVFDTSSGQTFNYFMSGSTIRDFPLFDTSSATSFFAFFQNCTFLQSVADLDTSNVTTFQQCFYQCHALYQIPNWDFSLGTNYYRFAYGSKISRFNITAATAPTNLKEVFRNASFLQQIDTFDWSAVTDTTNGFVNLSNLRRVIGCECPVNISFSNAYALQAAEIDEIFTDLPTVSGKTITVTGTAGASTCTPSIAQAKGWAVSN